MLKYLLTAAIIILLIVANILKNKLSKNKLFIFRTILIVLLLETTVFNINSYRTDLGSFKIKQFAGKELQEIVSNTLDGTQYISIENLDMKVKSIYLELDGLEEKQVVGYDIFYSDASTSNRYLASKEYFQDVEKTKYSTISLSGNCKSIGISIRNQNVEIKEVALNRLVPFEFNFVRVIGLIVICLIIYSLKTGKFWQEAYSQRNLKQNVALLLIIDIGILLIFFINNGCLSTGNDMYSEKLVKALSQGEVSISDAPDSDKLDALNDPYDAVERGKLQRDNDYIWDAAYYNHKYYVYFGALPALLLMVPFYLITKKFMISSVATLIFSLMSIPILTLITKKVFQKYFKEAPFKYMALNALMMILGTVLVWINVAPRFYELVTVAGFFFATLGYLLILDCEKENGKISYKEMFFGALSMAASVACRPTQLFASFLIVPILLRIFIKNIKEKKDIIKNILVVAIPYLTIATILMIYNNARFGRPFEFGEKYQLTVNNMQKLDLRLSLLPTGILCNLFGLPKFQGFFPFLHANGNLIDTFGYYYIEDMVAGVFFLAPIAFFCFAIFKVLKKSENKEFKIFVTSLLVVGLIFAVFISLKAGSTGRYLLDFAWMFVLCGISIFMEIWKNLKTDEGKIILGKVFNVIVCYTLIINILSSFCVVGGVNSMKNNTPKQYFDAEYTIMILK